METQTSESKTGPETDPRKKIMEAYREYVLLNGQEPPSIFAFCKSIDISEQDFYENFNDLSQVAGAFWAEMHDEVISELKEQSEYANFSAREKLLGYYYTLFEVLLKNRSFAILSFRESMSPLQMDTKHLQQLKKEFKEWSRELMEEGVRNGEVASRARLSNTYPDVFWLQFLFLVNFWRKDGSTGFSKTDAAVEKAVNLSFDLIEKNALDSALDFGKFIFQNR